VSVPNNDRPQGFPPEARLKARAEYKRIYASGRKWPGRFIVVFAAPAAGPGCRLGVTATKKMGCAVLRNRARRRVREIFRRWRAERVDSGTDFVVNVSDRTVSAPHAILRSELIGLFSRAAGGPP
jgi:ribonuclease P protein component